MESSLPVTSSTSSKSERRSRSKTLQNTSKPSALMAFLSCLAWLYVAGRLWQDAENRKLLADLLKKNSGQRPKVLTVEDKLMVLGCKELEKRIVEAEMELTSAKSQGYLKNQLQQNGASSGKKLLAVIGVYTGFGGRLRRNIIRGSWMSKADALAKLEERGIVVRFVIGRSSNRGDSLDRNIDEENRQMKDFLILDRHEEAQEELPKKAKFFFSTAIQMWDAEFYVKVDDNVDLKFDGLIELLQSRHGQDSAYIGCMKSGDVVAEEGRPWYEPEWWKFGDQKSYFRHAGGSIFILSKNLAQYININSASLKAYAHDDISVGSWMMGLQATYIDDSRLCCSYSGQDKIWQQRSMGYYDGLLLFWRLFTERLHGALVRQFFKQFEYRAANTQFEGHIVHLRNLNLVEIRVRWMVVGILLNPAVLFFLLMYSLTVSVHRFHQLLFESGTARAISPSYPSACV